MRTRRCKKSQSPTNVRHSFVEVKEEPEVKLNVCSQEELPPRETLKPTPKTVNKHSPSTAQPQPCEQKSSKINYSRSRATQVNSEEIDALSVRSLHLSNVQGENKPIKPIGIDVIIPQCRICLRRVSRANLRIILTKHKSKAQAALQIRVFPNDAYPFACSNCLNLIDIFLDFKASVMKARNLLLSERMHLESDGWDDPANIEAFNQCKAAVERHRMQIDTIFDEQMPTEERRNATVVEPKMELNVGEHERRHSNDNFHNFNHEQSTEVTHEMMIEPAIELELESDINEGELMLISHPTTNENIGNECGLITTLNANITPETPVENENCATENTISSIAKDCVHLSKRTKSKAIKYYSKPEQDFKDEDHTSAETNSSNDDDYIPETFEVALKKSKDSSDSEHKTKDDISTPEEQYVNKKAKAIRKKSGKPKKNKSTMKRPRNCKPSSILHVLCDLCGEKMRPETIEGHKNRHLGIKPYTCSVDGCEWTFYGRSNMSLHMRRRHPENGVPYEKCEICGKYIRGNRSIFNQHKKRHFLKEKSHVCQVCGKGFTLGRYLRQHSIIHTGLLPFECSYCGKKFNNKWSMQKHQKTMHEK